MSEPERALLVPAARRLAEAGIESPGREARLLLAHARALSADAAGYEALLARRAAREPLALILGRREFWSLDFAVSSATLIPRPDSETLIEAALAARPARGAVGRILDLGTGTGCLLLAALSEFPAAFGVGVDCVPQAATLAAANAAALGLAGRAAFLCGGWAGALSGRFDLILCNPPYIPSLEIRGLMPEVARFEPASALDGGADGLAAYRALIPALPALLADNGLAVLELGAGQAPAVVPLAGDAGFVPGLRMDLAGIPRALVLDKGQKNRLAGKDGQTSLPS